jgi:hypothetical protein
LGAGESTAREECAWLNSQHVAPLDALLFKLLVEKHRRFGPPGRTALKVVTVHQEKVGAIDAIDERRHMLQQAHEAAPSIERDNVAHKHVVQDV